MTRSSLVMLDTALNPFKTVDTRSSQITLISERVPSACVLMAVTYHLGGYLVCHLTIGLASVTAYRLIMPSYGRQCHTELLEQGLTPWKSYYVG